MALVEEQILEEDDQPRKAQPPAAIPSLLDMKYVSKLEELEAKVANIQDQLQDVEGIVDQLNDTSTQPGAAIIVSND